MKRIILLCSAVAVASLMSPAKAATCEVRPVVAADTGNVIGWAVTGEKGTIIVQDRCNAAAACEKVSKKPAPHDLALEVDVRDVPVDL